MVFLLARDWRAALAACLCAALLWLFRGESALPFFALAAFLLAARARGQKEEGIGAWRRTLEEEGAGLLCAALAGVILLAVFAGDAGLAAFEAFVAGLLFFPALAAALWTVFPRRRSVEQIYRSR
jgi:hypothetical protein